LLDAANTRLEADYHVRRLVLIKRAVNTRDTLMASSRRLQASDADVRAGLTSPCPCTDETAAQDQRVLLQTRLAPLNATLLPFSSHHPASCYGMTSAAAADIFLGRGGAHGVLGRLRAVAVSDAPTAALGRPPPTAAELRAFEVSWKEKIIAKREGEKMLTGGAGTAGAGAVGGTGGQVGLLAQRRRG
jgi:hypothetical protein